MIIEEEQAKSKWCPMVHIRHTAFYLPKMRDKAITETLEKQRVYANCIASDCMMWRWHPDYRQDGYCGLAGVPE